MTFFSFNTLFCCLWATISDFSIALRAYSFELLGSWTRDTLPNVPEPKTATCSRSISWRILGVSGLLVTWITDSLVDVAADKEREREIEIEIGRE